MKDEEGFMTQITSEMVKILRERTGAGMMDCKKALVSAEGDMDKAEVLIAQSGHKKAAKSASRTAAQGRITILSTEEAIAMTEVNCETDFVARDESFVQFCQMTTENVLAQKEVEIDKVVSILVEQQSIDDRRKNLIARLGENVQIRRAVVLNKNANQRFGSYVHHARIGAVVLMEGGTDTLAKEIAMHLAAMRPQYVSMAEVPAVELEKQKAIMLERAKETKKPDNILEKIISGQLAKHFAELCLLDQAFFKDPDTTVGALLNSAHAKILHMIRFEVGEGIEVAKKSFEEEVREARGGEL